MQNLIPLAGGNRWRYAFNGTPDDPVEFVLGPPEPVALGDYGTLLAWPLGNPLTEGAVIVPGEGSVTVYRTTWVGTRGSRSVTVDAEYRRYGPAAWRFRYAGGGCVITEVEVCRGSVERISVPAGTYDCLRFDLGDGRSRSETHWLCEGVGIVKRQDRGEGDCLELLEARLRQPGC